MSLQLRLPARPRAMVLDLAIVAAVLVIGELNVWRFDSVAGPRWLTTLLVLLLALPLAFRRSAPLLSCSLVVAAIVIQAVVSGNSAEGFQLILAGGVAAYSVAAYSDRRHALLGLGLFVVGYRLAFGSGCSLCPCYRLGHRRHPSVQHRREPSRHLLT